jgi:transcriptional regulator with XRE-family HTH domain
MKNLFALTDQAAVEKESLSQYAARLIKEKGISASDVELRAGGEISYSHIAGILAGDVENLRFETLRAIARGLGVAEERLFAIAIGSAMPDLQECDFALLYRKYAILSGEDKEQSTYLLELLQREIERMRQRESIKMKSGAQFNALIDCVGPPPPHKRENLKEYVRRIFREQRLTLKKVVQRSHQKISSAYVGNILYSSTSNLTTEKIQALACGLEVSAYEIFAILQGDGSAQWQDFAYSPLADLYHKYQALSLEGKKELQWIIELVDREIDKKQMQKLRLSTRREIKTRGCQPKPLTPQPTALTEQNLST